MQQLFWLAAPHTDKHEKLQLRAAKNFTCLSMLCQETVYLVTCRRNDNRFEKYIGRTEMFCQTLVPICAKLLL